MSDNRKDSNRKSIKTGGRAAGGANRKRNPNLRLIKNGDLPVETPSSGEPEKSGEKLPADISSSAKKEKSSGEARPVKKADSGGKATSGKKADSGGESSSGKKAGGGKSSSGKKAGGGGKSSSGKKADSGGKSSSGKKTKAGGKTSTVKQTKKTKKQPTGKKTDGGNGKAEKADKPVKKSVSPWEYGGRPREERSLEDWYLQHRSLVITGFSIFLLVVLLAAGYYYIVKTYTVTTVYVDGNVHYTNEEVMDLVMTGRYGKNSLYLAMKYRNRGVEGIPFVEKMDVNILSPDTIRISVYEKALAGYVEYLGRYMYFDKDGIIVESSAVRTSGIPQVTGLSFDYVILHEPLPIENEEIFRKILNITQLLKKYDLSADRIFFDSTYDVTVYFEGVRVTLGASEELDEKIMKLQYILPELKGKKGILRMENYTEDTRSIPFNQD